MKRYHLLPIALVGFIGTLGGMSVAPAQPAANPDIVKPPTVTPPIAKPPIAKPAIAMPTTVKPAEAKPLDPPPMTFFVATGEANACGLGCEAWIAADGKIDLSTAQRLRKLLAKLGRRKLPIVLHSGGGSVLGAIELGRLIRSRNIAVSVARTIPDECSRDHLSDKSCDALKRSSKDLLAELDTNSAMCNSACVLALSGGAMRSVPPLVRLGVHAIGIDIRKSEVPRAALAAATRDANSRIMEFLHDMGINKALFDASNSVPHEQTRFLQRDELVRFGIDTRDFGETDWRFVEKPNVAVAKGFFVHTSDADRAHPEALLRLDCGAGAAMRLTFARERSASNQIGAGLRPLRVTLNRSRIDLPYATSSGNIEIRTTPLWPNAIDSAGDDGAVEISGFDPKAANDLQGRIVLNMAGFSAAYARLRKACDDSSSVASGCGAGDLSPRCMPEALKTWPTIPSTAGGQAASPSR